jgi:drug/metabolite transporter (DMT)-like permease
MKIFYNILIFAAYAIFSGSGLIILKIAMSQRPLSLDNIFQIFINMKFFIGLFLYGCGFMVWLVILSKFKLNIAYPIAISLFFVVSGLGSYFILKESFSLQHIVGIVLCFLGIVLIGIK